MLVRKFNKLQVSQLNEAKKSDDTSGEKKSVKKTTKKSTSKTTAKGVKGVAKKTSAAKTPVAKKSPAKSKKQLEYEELGLGAFDGPKYKLLLDSKIVKMTNGKEVRVHRIQYKINVSGVTKGQLGGWMEARMVHEYNPKVFHECINMNFDISADERKMRPILAQTDNSVITHDAIVAGNCCIGNEDGDKTTMCVVCNDAKVFGMDSSKILITGNTIIADNAVVEAGGYKCIIMDPRKSAGSDIIIRGNAHICTGIKSMTKYNEKYINSVVFKTDVTVDSNAVVCNGVQIHDIIVSERSDGADKYSISNGGRVIISGDAVISGGKGYVEIATLSKDRIEINGKALICAVYANIGINGIVSINAETEIVSLKGEIEINGTYVKLPPFDQMTYHDSYHDAIDMPQTSYAAGVGHFRTVACNKSMVPEINISGNTHIMGGVRICGKATIEGDGSGHSPYIYTNAAYDKEDGIIGKVNNSLIYLYGMKAPLSIKGGANITGACYIDGVKIDGNPKITGNAEISEDECLRIESYTDRKSRISAVPLITGNPSISGNVNILGAVQIDGSAQISGDVKLKRIASSQTIGFANLRICNKAKISGHTTIYFVNNFEFILGGSCRISDSFIGDHTDDDEYYGRLFNDFLKDNDINMCKIEILGNASIHKCTIFMSDKDEFHENDDPNTLKRYGYGARVEPVPLKSGEDRLWGVCMSIRGSSELENLRINPFAYVEHYGKDKNFIYVSSKKYDYVKMYGDPSFPLLKFVDIDVKNDYKPIHGQADIKECMLGKKQITLDFDDF